MKKWLDGSEFKDLEYPGDIVSVQVPVVGSPLVCSFSLFDPSSPPPIPHVVSNINLFCEDVSKARALVQMALEDSEAGELVSFEPVLRDSVMTGDSVVCLKLSDGAFLGHSGNVAGSYIILGTTESGMEIKAKSLEVCNFCGREMTLEHKEPAPCKVKAFADGLCVDKAQVPVTNVAQATAKSVKSLKRTNNASATSDATGAEEPKSAPKNKGPKNKKKQAGKKPNGGA